MGKITKELYQSCICDIQKHLRIQETSKVYREEVAQLFTGENNDSELLQKVSRSIVKKYHGHVMPPVFVWTETIREAKGIKVTVYDTTEKPATKNDFTNSLKEYFNENGSFLGFNSYEEYKRKTSVKGV